MKKINYAPWNIVRMIGKGSLGTVYEIEREENGKTERAALRVISIPRDEEDTGLESGGGINAGDKSEYYKSCVEELTHEFAMLVKVKGQANIVSYDDQKVIPHANGIGWDIYIRMELLTPLVKYLEKKALSRNQVIKLGIDLCQALSACEKKNIIHRNIKPDNIFISKEGDFKLGDFGLSRVASKTLANMSQKGTPNYMAPEVYLGQKYNDTVDIYSLGIVLYQLMNENRLPFDNGTRILHEKESAFGKRISGARLPSPVNCDFPFASIILKACAYRTEDRYQTADEMMRDLELLLNGQKPKFVDTSEYWEEISNTDQNYGDTQAAKEDAVSRASENKKGANEIPFFEDADATFLGTEDEIRREKRIDAEKDAVSVEERSQYDKKEPQHQYENLRHIADPEILNNKRRDADYRKWINNDDYRHINGEQQYKNDEFRHAYSKQQQNQNDEFKHINNEWQNGNNHYKHIRNDRPVNNGQLRKDEGPQYNHRGEKQFHPENEPGPYIVDGYPGAGIKNSGGRTKKNNNGSKKVLAIVIAIAAAAIVACILLVGIGTDKFGGGTSASATFTSGRIDRNALNRYVNDFLGIKIDAPAGWTGMLGKQSGIEEALKSDDGYDDFNAHSGDNAQEIHVTVYEEDSKVTNKDIAEVTDAESVEKLVDSYKDDENITDVNAEKNRKVQIGGQTYTAVTIRGNQVSGDEAIPFWHVYCIGGVGKYQVQISLVSYGNDATDDLLDMISKA